MSAASQQEVPVAFYASGTVAPPGGAALIRCTPHANGRGEGEDVTFFDEQASGAVAPASEAPREPSWWSTTAAKVGLTSLVVALVALFTMGFVPSGYVIEQPGPVINTLGTVPVKDADGNVKDIPLVTIADEQTYDTDGSLSLTTISIAGSREQSATWMELLVAWFDVSKAVLPVDEVFPEGQTVEDRNEANQVMMEDSQQRAAIAALRELGYEFDTVPVVNSVQNGAPADGKLLPGDVLLAVDGTAITKPDEVATIVQAADGAAVTFTVRREGAEQDVTITPHEGEVEGEKRWLVGISVASYVEKLPVDITFEVGNVGGPSAGMMFALAIYDMLTPGELTGGAEVAGTGTIDAEGNVGAIGGIAQKMYGAKQAGADYFLAPETNCKDVVGHVPDGLQVISTATLEDSIAALEVIASGDGIDKLPTCTAPGQN